MTTRRSIPVVFTAEEIRDRVDALAHEIAKDIPEEVMIVSLLKGSFMFTSDLIRALYHIGLHPQLDFMTLASYGTGTKSGGEVTVLRDITESVKGRHLLIVDDILETGRTLHAARQILTDRGAQSTKVCVLLEKPGKTEVPVVADYIGFRIADRFVVGYGLDYANHYRELPFIGALDVH